ncbi:TPA: ATP-binding protein [Escherichia coli]|nr:ATP-binding protein [Salmonella enterica]HCN4220542.1 ATP-binding protein [Escherichia coli]
MRIKHLNTINMNMNMNMMKEAIDVLINSEKHILIIGETGTGKSTLLTELRINDTDVKHFDFCDIHPPLKLKHHYLCDENFDDFDFLSAPEKTLVLDSVAIGNNLRESKVVQFIVRFIKTARKRGKRLIVVTTPSDGVQIQNLFDTVISLTRSHDEIGCTVIGCTVIIPVPELIKYE